VTSVANQTQAQAAVLETAAKKFEQTNHELEGMLSRLLSELEVLQTAWRGRGGRSFEEVKRAWAEDQRTLHRALGETAMAIRTAGRGYTTSDTDAADRVAASHHGLTLPL
jgi:WXG100 family type VII secretion target